MRTKEALAVRKAEGVKLGRRYGSYTKTNILRAGKNDVIRMLEQGRSIAASLALKQIPILSFQVGRFLCGLTAFSA